jgi:hypothetical protein
MIESASEDARLRKPKNLSVPISPTTFAAVAATIASAAPTVPSTSTTPAVSTSATATPATTWTFFTGPSFIHGQIAASHVFAVKRFDRFLRVVFIFHGHEAKTARTAAQAIHDHINLLNRAISGEEVLQIIFRGVE